jgi:hypothetical protein
MGQKNVDAGTEWIFCTNIKGQCAGVNSDSLIIDKVEKRIMVNGKEVQGWMVKITQEKSEGHLKLDLSQRSDE